MDFQDCQYISGHYALCSGLNEFTMPTGNRFSFGGIDLLNLKTMSFEWQIPVPLWTENGVVMTNNPFYIQSTKNGIIFYFMPEDNKSTIYVYETELKFE